MQESRKKSDFSRQLKVSGMDAEKQAKLEHARVLVFGAGGLGATAIPWLVAAGVGHLTVVDGDTVSASNLHRQIPFAYEDIGRHKAEVMADFCRARMSDDHTCTAICKELDGQALLDMVRSHDVVLDCSDSRALAYLLNDAALIADRPVVFANAAALAGQLFVLHPSEETPCWRCLWPEDVLPGGNCDVLGVLGPVPGVFGLYQALETLKLITAFVDPLRDHVLQYDFATLRQFKLRVERMPGCHHHPDIQALEPVPLFQDTLPAAQTQGWYLLDIRTEQEQADRPLLLADAEVPMDILLAEAARYLPPDRKVLLVCASGRRAQAAAKTLRRRGYERVAAFPAGW